MSGCCRCDSCSRWSLESAESVTRAVGDELQQSVARLDVGFWTPVRIELYVVLNKEIKPAKLAII